MRLLETERRQLIEEIRLAHQAPPEPVVVAAPLAAAPVVAAPVEAPPPAVRGLRGRTAPSPRDSWWLRLPRNRALVPIMVTAAVAGCA